MVGNVDFRKHLLDFRWFQNGAVYSHCFIVGRPGRQSLHRRSAVSEGKVSLLTEHEIIIQILSQVFIEFQTLVIEEDPFFRSVIGT